MSARGREIIHVPGVLMKGYLSVGVCVSAMCTYRSAGEVHFSLFFFFFLDFLYFAALYRQK